MISDFECRCKSCSDLPKKSFSQEWMAECEARWALSLQQHERQDYLALVEKKRGKPARDILDAWMMEVWTRSRAA